MEAVILVLVEWLLLEGQYQVSFFKFVWLRGFQSDFNQSGALSLEM